MTLNDSGVRDIARVLRVSPIKMIQELKKRETSQTNQSETITTSEIRAD